MMMSRGKLPPRLSHEEAIMPERSGLDEDGLDPIEALVANAVAAEPHRMVHEGGEYYAERIIRRAIQQGTLALARPERTA